MTGDAASANDPAASYVREFANEASELRPMSAWLRASCADLGASPSMVADAEICANEWFANLCAHAFPDGGVHRIAMALSAAPGGVRLVVEDDGMPFDPIAVPLPAPPATLSEARPGGHGLGLIRSLVRTIRHEREGGRNRLTLEFAGDRA
jgi:anti-sigma regulatory factor (Ser/Thr protein kinase)